MDDDNYMIDIDIVVAQHTHAGSGDNTVKTVTAHTHARALMALSRRRFLRTSHGAYP